MNATICQRYRLWSGADSCLTSRSLDLMSMLLAGCYLLMMLMPSPARAVIGLGGMSSLKDKENSTPTADQTDHEYCAIAENWSPLRQTPNRVPASGGMLGHPASLLIYVAKLTSLGSWPFQQRRHHRCSTSARDNNELSSSNSMPSSDGDISRRCSKRSFPKSKAAVEVFSNQRCASAASLVSSFGLYYVLLQNQHNPRQSFSSKHVIIQSLRHKYAIAKMWPTGHTPNMFVAYGRRHNACSRHSQRLMRHPEFPEHVLWVSDVPISHKARPQISAESSVSMAIVSVLGRVELLQSLLRAKVQPNISLLTLGPETDGDGDVPNSIMVDFRAVLRLPATAAPLDVVMNTSVSLLLGTPDVLSVESVPSSITPQVKSAIELVYHGTQADFSFRTYERGHAKRWTSQRHGAYQTIGIADFGLNHLHFLLFSPHLSKIKWTPTGPEFTKRYAPHWAIWGVSEPISQYVEYERSADPLNDMTSTDGKCPTSLLLGRARRRYNADWRNRGFPRRDDERAFTYSRDRITHGTSVSAIVAAHFSPPETTGIRVGDSGRLPQYYNRSLQSCFEFIGVAPHSKIAFFDLRGAVERGPDVGIEPAIDDGIADIEPYEADGDRIVIPGLDYGRHVLSWAHSEGARIHLNAWTTQGGYEGARFGYDWLARDIDRFMYKTQDSLVISAAGINTETSNGIVSPCLSKNGICAGASMTTAGWIDHSRASYDVNRAKQIFPELFTAPQLGCHPGDQNIPWDTARGPTADGRIKPDLVAPGFAATASADSTATCTKDAIEDSKKGCAWEGVAEGELYGNININLESGSSVAAAVIAGLAITVRQVLFARLVGSYGRSVSGAPISPSGALVKAVLIGCSQPLFGPRLDEFGCPARDQPPIYDVNNPRSPNPHIGWGRPQMDRSGIIKAMEPYKMYMPGNNPRLHPPTGDASLEQGDVHKYVFCAYSVDDHANAAFDKFTPDSVDDVADTSITLVWTDPPSMPLMPNVLVNDLDLQVWYTDHERPGIPQHYWGNHGDTPDRLNPVERVVMDGIPRGTVARTFTISVKAHRVVDEDEPQRYALAVIGRIRPEHCSITTENQYLPLQGGHTALHYSWILLEFIFYAGVYAILLGLFYFVVSCSWVFYLFSI